MDFLWLKGSIHYQIIYLFRKNIYVSHVLGAVFMFFLFFGFNKYAASFPSSCESLPIGAAYGRRNKTIINSMKQKAKGT